MNDLKRITIIILRIQAVCFVIMALIQWAIIAGMLLIASLRETPSQLENFEFMLLFGALYFLVGFILYARSRSLANHFVAAVEGDAETVPPGTL